MKNRSNLLLYLLLNIIVSAATTLIVLWAWDNYSGSARIAQRTGTPAVAPTLAVAAPAVLGENTIQPTAPAPVIPEATAGPTETALPSDAKLIEIVSVVGAGDPQQEVVLLRRIGEGNLRMVGWKLTGEHNNTFTFPEQPELTLYEDGAVQVYTGPGPDTVTEVYWNREAAAWRSGETLRLLDPSGAERATFKVP